MRKKQRKAPKHKTKRRASRSKQVRNKRSARKIKIMPRAGQVSKRQKRAQKLQRKRPTHYLKGKTARRVLIYADGRERVVVVSVRMASLVGKFMAGVRWFVQTNDLHHTEPFAGKVITDVFGKHHSLETRPNILHRLAHTGASSFEQIYRIVI